jgi:hypothetical protein
MNIFVGNLHIPPDLVVDQWASDAESGSPPDFLLRHDLWTTFRRLMMSQITSTISTVWDFPRNGLENDAA